MRHRNVIDSVKDNTGLLPCKKNEKKNGEGWVMSSSCDGWQVISYRDVRSILCFSHSTVVSWQSQVVGWHVTVRTSTWSKFLVQRMKWYYSFLYCVPAEEHIHPHKANQLDMKEEHMYMWNVSIKDTYYMNNSGLMPCCYQHQVTLTCQRETLQKQWKHQGKVLSWTDSSNTGS